MLPNEKQELCKRLMDNGVIYLLLDEKEIFILEKKLEKLSLENIAILYYKMGYSDEILKAAKIGVFISRIHLKIETYKRIYGLNTLMKLYEMNAFKEEKHLITPAEVLLAAKLYDVPLTGTGKFSSTFEIKRIISRNESEMLKFIPISYLNCSSKVNHYLEKQKITKLSELLENYESLNVEESIYKELEEKLKLLPQIEKEKTMIKQ